jgi:V/A-type H+-transporting ATPase subunit A
MLRAGNEVDQMMKVVGEEGTPTEDFVTYLKSELLDRVYLQQNVFDEADAESPAEQQELAFALVMTVLDGAFQFADKADARSFFQKLTQAFLDWNSTVGKGEIFVTAKAAIERLIQSALDA